jgi:hypothetical protein
MDISDQYLGCSECAHKQTVRDALDGCFASWPQHYWIAFRCPNCGSTNHLEVREGSIAEGCLDGVPGPSMRFTRRLRLEDFHVRTSADSIDIRSLNLHWEIATTAPRR